jgi:peroxiredoxin (alkyl hydroperoxide reductase subunit C)
MLIDEVAPEFTATACMPDNSFAEVSLKSFRGKYVILFFYPADFTFVCASEVPGFSKLIKEFEGRNCVVLGCSTDTHHCHKGWKLLPKEQGGIGEVAYPLVADATKEIASAYDVLQKDGLCARGLFLIDKEGVVKAEHRNCDPLGRNLDEPLRLLDALQFHEESIADGNKRVCPASWKLGKRGLKPTLEGVGEFNKEGGVSQYV